MIELLMSFFGGDRVVERISQDLIKARWAPSQRYKDFKKSMGVPFGREGGRIGRTPRHNAMYSAKK